MIHIYSSTEDILKVTPNIYQRQIKDKKNITECLYRYRFKSTEDGKHTEDAVPKKKNDDDDINFFRKIRWFWKKCAIDKREEEKDTSTKIKDCGQCHMD
jgi:hypothetical protein